MDPIGPNVLAKKSLVSFKVLDWIFLSFSPDTTLVILVLILTPISFSVLSLSIDLFSLFARISSLISSNNSLSFNVSSLTSFNDSLSNNSI